MISFLRERKRKGKENSKMPIVTGKTPAGLVKHAQKALNEKWWYVWGTFGNVLTESLLESKAKQYPTYTAEQTKLFIENTLDRRHVTVLA